MDLKVTVKHIKGNCPVYQKGDSFMLRSCYQLESEKPLCMHGLCSIMPYYNALRFSQPKDWGLEGKEEPNKAYVQCPDAVDHTGGGNVTFEIEKI